MKKQLLSITLLMGSIATSSYSMELTNNSYNILNRTPDAKIILANPEYFKRYNMSMADVAPGASSNFGSINVSDFFIKTPYKTYTFNEPGSYTVTLKKVQDPQNNKLSLYELTLENRKTGEVKVKRLE